MATRVFGSPDVSILGRPVVRRWEFQLEGGVDISAVGAIEVFQRLFDLTCSPHHAEVMADDQ